MELDPAGLRERLRRRSPPGPSVYGDEEAGREGVITPASVLVPVVAHPGGLTVLFTQRTSQLRSHSGQISLKAGQVEVLGRLPEYLTRTGYRVTPVVGLLTPPLELTPDPREVQEVFEVPLAFLLDPRNHQRRTREFQGRSVSFYAIPYGSRDIWGVTAGILVNFSRRLAD